MEYYVSLDSIAVFTFISVYCLFFFFAFYLHSNSYLEVDEIVLLVSSIFSSVQHLQFKIANPISSAINYFEYLEVVKDLAIIICSGKWQTKMNERRKDGRNAIKLPTLIH